MGRASSTGMRAILKVTGPVGWAGAAGEAGAQLPKTRPERMSRLNHNVKNLRIDVNRAELKSVRYQILRSDPYANPPNAKTVDSALRDIFNNARSEQNDKPGLLDYHYQNEDKCHSKILL